MLTISAARQKLLPVSVLLGVTLAFWLGSKWWYDDWFSNPAKYIAKAASLTALVLMCCCSILAARGRFMERYFGGLDKMYQAHKRLGRYSFFIVLLHPLFLTIDRLPDISAFARALWLQPAAEDTYALGHNAGIAVLGIFAVLIGLTVARKLPYHRWKRSHELMTVLLMLVALHVILVNADVSRYPLLAVLVYGLMGWALASCCYIRFFYAAWGPRFPHRIASIDRSGAVLEFLFEPLGRKMNFRPGQFVYLVVNKDGITPEPHPYSIASGYNLEANVKLGIKQLGDHTKTLSLLEVGDRVLLYGPYGHFSDAFLRADRDCVFIGAGIGITPFIGMWHVALHSEEQLDPNEVSAPVRSLHPEILRTWKSPLVSLFYVCANSEEASFDNDIRNEVILSRFHGFPELEQRGHHYELYLSLDQGKINARYIDSRVPGGIRNKYLFMCGPSPMVDALTRQFTKMGVPPELIITEDFNLV